MYNGKKKLRKEILPSIDICRVKGRNLKPGEKEWNPITRVGTIM